MRVIGIGNDGGLICQDGGEPYNCGETLEVYGVDNLTSAEKKAIDIHDTEERKVLGVLGSELYCIENIGEDGWQSVFPSQYAEFSHVHLGKREAEEYVREKLEELGGTPVFSCAEVGAARRARTELGRTIQGMEAQDRAEEVNFSEDSTSLRP